MTKCEVTFSVIIYVIKNDYHICVFSKSLYQYFMLWVHKILNWIKAQQHRTYDIEMCVYNNCVCYMCMLKSYQGIKCTWMYIPNHTISRFAYHFFTFSHHIVHIINVQTRKEIVFLYMKNKICDIFAIRRMKNWNDLTLEALWLCGCIWNGQKQFLNHHIVGKKLLYFLYVIHGIIYVWLQIIYIVLLFSMQTIAGDVRNCSSRGETFPAFLILKTFSI